MPRRVHAVHDVPRLQRDRFQGHVELARKIIETRILRASFPIAVIRTLLGWMVAESAYELKTND